MMSLCDVDLVIKFGGSAVTVKDNFETLNTEALCCAADLIRRCVEKKLTCIVVHGAGSFGHHQAKEYQVNEGWKTVLCAGEHHVKKGFCLTRQSVTKLHHKVLDSLIEKDVPAVGLSACGVWKTENGKVICYDLGAVNEVIQNGFIPVLHGDCVYDTVKGCSILSGDTIIQKISEDFSVGRIVFLASVLGIYDKPPLEFPDAIVLKHIFVDRNGKISYSQIHACTTTKVDNSSHSTDLVNYAEGVQENYKPLGNQCSESRVENSSKTIVTQIDGKDVTGGMMHKIRCAVDIVRRNKQKTSVFVCKVGSVFSNDICLYNICERNSEDCGTEISYSDLL